MNGQKAKLLRKIAKLSGLEYSDIKKHYKSLNEPQRVAISEEYRELVKENSNFSS